MSADPSIDRSQVVASILIALIETKQIALAGATAAARGADVGEAFKKLYEAVSTAERSY